MKFIYFLTLSFAALPSFANPIGADGRLDFKSQSYMGVTSCNFDGKKAHIFMTSPSGEVSEDDMSLWIVNEEGKAVPVNFNGATAWFEFESGSIGAFYQQWPKGEDWRPEACAGTLSVPLENGLFAILFSNDKRISGKALSVFIYDSQKHEVLASDIDLGGYAKLRFSWTNLVRVKDGFAFETVNLPSDSGACPPGNCGSIGKKKMISVSEEVLPSWSRVTYRDGKLEKKEDRELTWEKSPVKKFFKSQEDFEKKFEYDAKSKSFGFYWYNVALMEDETECLHPSKDRDWMKALKPSQWICLPK